MSYFTFVAEPYGAIIHPGDDGKDTIFGGDGIDLIDGADGPDTIHGLAGDDVLSGGSVSSGDIKRVDQYSAYEDVIFGGGGDDLIEGGLAKISSLAERVTTGRSIGSSTPTWG
jgi:Ca2+-binding RTX toxin-like protein